MHLGRRADGVQSAGWIRRQLLAVAVLGGWSHAAAGLQGCHARAAQLQQSCAPAAAPRRPRAPGARRSASRSASA